MASPSNAIIYLCRYNNYANREEKDLGKIIYDINVANTSDYGRVDAMAGIDFNPGDGVSTTLICNRGNDEAADYAFVYDATKQFGQITSRWFIMRSDRLRNGQYRLTLKRDLIADFYSDIEDSPIYVEKATLRNDDPMIYNDEPVGYNQIKTSQTPLADPTGCGWIVGFVQNDTSSQAGVHSVSITYPFDAEVSGITSWPMYKYLGKTWRYAKDRSYVLIYGGRTAITDYVNRLMAFRITGTFATDLLASDLTSNAATLQGNTFTIFDRVNSLLKGDAMVQQLVEGFEEFNPDNGVSDSIFKQLAAYDGQIIRDSSTGLYYKFSLGLMSVGDTYWTHAMNHLRQDESEFLEKLKSPGVVWGTPNAETLWTSLICGSFTPTLTEVHGASMKMTYKWPASYTHLQDAPYSMFCIPCPVDGHAPNFTPPPVDYDEQQYAFDVGNMSRDMSMSLATGIATNLGATSGFLIDLMYLPYCPIGELRNSGFTGYVYKDAFWARDESKCIDYVPVFWAYRSSFELTVAHSIAVPNKKISHCCDKYRLMSPNFANFDEFDPAMNGGVSGFHIIATYKPFTPFICVHMNYANLYGKDFDDNRGLTLGGDFSIPVVSDEWTNYQINNKNYANIFDRQIKYQDDMFAYERAKNYVGAFTNSISGAANGFKVGGAVGAAVGGTLSLAGGLADAAMEDQKHKNTIQYQTDMYNYNLQNIQARPDTLVKTSSINSNNTTWPIIEYFTCTDVEKQAFQDKLEYNGMTVMRIGTLSEFRNLSGRQYFQGRLIQCDDFPGDANMFASLQDEIAQGFHIIGG